MSEPFIVSAPGKVILFGEHSAVYGKPAIAAALSLRAYLLVTPSENPKEVLLEFPDIELSQSWNIDDIPFEKIHKYVETVEGKPKITEELLPEVVEAIGDLIMGLDVTNHYTTCHCFLYLYSILCSASTPGMKFLVRSTLPIGAGLGLSASISVCLASALASLGGHIDKAELSLNDKIVSKHNPSNDFIDQWSFMGEKCFHGNPSGIDNAVATHGGAVMFQRVHGKPSVRTTMRNVPPLDLLLTNTKIPRSTADLVANVARIYTEYPKTGESLIDGMGHLVTDAYLYMIRPLFGQEERNKLRELFNINHGFLVAYGVSHPALEKIKIIAEEHKLGATKLTGAGGGGCAITLMNDDVDESQIEKAKKEFDSLGFETYETFLGGKGVGILNLNQVEEPQREAIFNDQVFAAYKSNQELIENLAVENVPGWRFW